MLAEKIISQVKALAHMHKIRKNRGYVAATAIFDSKNYTRVIEIINSTTDAAAKNGEKISSEISSGKIIDSGVKQFEILKGALIEIYDYKRTSAAFVRVYRLRSRGKNWVALYIDENPETPWWSEEERRG